MSDKALMNNIVLSYIVICYGISIFGLLLHFLLLYLSIKENRIKDEKGMTVIFLIDTISNIILAIIFLITNPQIEIHHGLLFIKFGGIVQFIYNPIIKFIFLGLIFGSYICVFTILPTEYIQRYHIICKNRSLDKKELIISYGTTFLYSLVVGFIHACNFDYTIPEEIKISTNLSSTILYDEKYDAWNNLIVLNKKLVFHIISGIIFMIMITSTYVSIPYNIYKMSLTFKKNKNVMTIKSIKLQQQFNRILYLQMIISVFIMLIPLMTIFCLLFSYSSDIDGFGFLIILGFQSIPFFNSISVIFMTPKFRKIVLCHMKLSNLNQTTDRVKNISRRKTHSRAF
uniref:G_PROTEIN_RECEP_F1_2 domain-containing protein n=1 Tax=Strongyloides venezuelensis TaxID=75913 RepID=A0A0K0FRR0_STRVS